MVALLPMPIKNRDLAQKLLDELRQTNREVLNEVPWRVIQSVTCQQNPSAESVYYKVRCADCDFRLCKQDSAAWHEDCAEYSDPHHLERHVCFRSECPKKYLGDYVPPDKQHPRWDHNPYRTLSDANTKAANAEHSSLRVHRGFNVFQHIPCIVSDLPKPDLLHTMHIGMLDHLQKCILHFMKTHKRLDKYNAIWLSLPAYHDLLPKNKSYEEVSQWNGKEIKNICR